MTNSCFITKISHYLPLDDVERNLLGRLEEEERQYDRNTDVYVTGEEMRSIFIVKEGWCYDYTDLPDGRRQIVRIHHPGDFVGVPDIAFRSRTTTLRACTAVTLCPMPKHALDDIFEQSARLTALLFTVSNRDQVIFIELLRAIARMDARERLSHLLLQLLSRLRITNPRMNARFRLPLTQHEIGDAIGLSHVYVSKTLGRLEADGWIRRDGREVTIVNEEAMVELCDFVDRFHEIDTSWFPK